MAAFNVSPTQNRTFHGRVPLPACKEPFTFNNGQQARTASELVLLCEMFALEGADHLLSGRVECWLSEIGYSDLAALAARARLSNGSVASRLDQFLHATGLPLQADLMIHERRVANRPRRQSESEARRHALEVQQRVEANVARQAATAVQIEAVHQAEAAFQAEAARQAAVNISAEAARPTDAEPPAEAARQVEAASQADLASVGMGF